MLLLRTYAKEAMYSFIVIHSHTMLTYLMKCQYLTVQAHYNLTYFTEPFKTFICSNCKSAHQGYSHRVKSISMSSWTQDEVSELKSKNGGGNKKARKIWLADYDTAKKHMPKKGDSLDKYKDFINKVYELKKFYRENEEDDDSDDDKPAAPVLQKQNSGKANKAKQSNSNSISDSFESMTLSPQTSMNTGFPPALTLKEPSRSANDLFAGMVIGSNGGQVAITSKSATSSPMPHTDVFDAFSFGGSMQVATPKTHDDLFTAFNNPAVSMTPPLVVNRASPISALFDTNASAMRMNEAPPSIPFAAGSGGGSYGLPPRPNAFIRTPTPVSGMGGPPSSAMPNNFGFAPMGRASPSLPMGGSYGPNTSYTSSPAPLPMWSTNKGSSIISNIDNFLPVDASPPQPQGIKTVRSGSPALPVTTPVTKADPFASLFS